jgi:hypothetical protein
MKQPHVLLKVTAVVSSVLLAGGYVCYRAGAINGLLTTSSPPEQIPPEAAPTKQPSVGNNIPWDYTWIPSTTILQSNRPSPFLAGPKSAGIDFVPPSPKSSKTQLPAAAQQSPPSTKQQKPAMLPSSKLGLIQ